MKGRKPKPTHLKVVTGNPGNRPLNKNEPQPTSHRPTPPAHLSKEAKTEWRRVAPMLHAIGVLTTLDRAALAVYCQAYGRWVRAEQALERMAEKEPATQALMMKTKAGNLIQNPLVGTANKAMESLCRAAAELGMTPSARSRVEGNVGGKAKASRQAAEFFGD